MWGEWINSAASYHCPECGETRVAYREIEASQWHYTLPDGDHVEYFGPVRDCKCGNCDATWLLEVSEP